MTKEFVPVKVLGMYVSKMTGIVHKQVKTYLRFQFPDDYSKDTIIGEGIFDIPATDLYGAYPKVAIGKIILLGKEPEGYRYLGPEGDWQTMMNSGFTKSPYEFVSAKDLGKKFTNFSEITGEDNVLSVEIDGKKYSIYLDKEKRLAIAPPSCDNLYAKKLLKDLAKKLGYNFKDKTYLD